MRRPPVLYPYLLITALVAVFATAPAQAQVTALTLGVDKSSPQRVGTTMTFTAPASGGSGPYEYKYWLGTMSGSYEPMSPDYVAESTLVWTPTVAGSYKVMVYARSQGSTAAFEKSATKTGYWVVAEPPVTAVVLSASKFSPQQVGMPVTFTASASGGSESYEYQFWLAKGSGAYRLVKDYTVAGNAWTPAAGDMDAADSYVVKVNARNERSIAPFEKFKTVTFVMIEGVPVKSVSLAADKASPQDLATVGTVTFTAAAVPGAPGGVVEYQFWLFTSASGKYVAVGDVTSDYSAAKIWHFTPTAADTYKVMVYARTVGNTVAYEKLKVVFFTVFDLPPTLGDVTPAVVTSPAGSPRTISAVYSDVKGYQELKIVSLLVNETASVANAVYARYDRSIDRLHLVDDAGTAYVGNCVPGSAATLTNSQGSLNCAATSVAGSGDDLTVDWSITPKPGFVSETAKNLYTHVKDNDNVQVGWVDKGDWTIAGGIDLALCEQCHNGNPAYPLAPNVIDGPIPGGDWSYNWYGTDSNIQDGGHGDPQGRDSAATVPTCAACHDLSQPAPGNLHLNGIHESIWDNTTRNANTSHLKAEFFTKYPANEAGAWSIQVAFDRYCYLECHATKRVLQMTHETDTQPDAPAHDAVKFGTHLTVANADAMRWEKSYPSDRDLTTNATGAPFFAVCVSCHDPHGTTVPPQGGSRRLMLRDDWATGSAPLCGACHL